MKFFYPEGATPIHDITDLKIHWVKTQQDLNQVEAENILRATKKFLLKPIKKPDQWFFIHMLRTMHQEMFDDVWEWAGKFRTNQTIPGIKPFLISESLKNLCHDVQYWSKFSCHLSLIEQAARIHHRLVFIHPYPNGNGRFARLVADRFLKSWNYLWPNWPIDLDRDGENRQSYIMALKEADRGNYTPLIAFMMKHGAKPGITA